jgi:hypothetical protein
MFNLYSGPSKVEYYPKKASTAMSVGDLLKFDGSGYVTVCAAGTATNVIVGVSLRKVASTDADYASTTLIPVEVGKDSIYIADIGTGTGAASNVGGGFDLAAAGTLDVTATTHKQVTCVGFISTTQLLVKLNGDAQYKDLV